VNRRIKQLNPILLMIAVLLIAWLPATPLLAAQIDLRVLPDQVQMGDSLRLIYTATGSVDDEPDFSALTTDFEILTNQSSSKISLINGDYSRSKTWTLDLIPRRMGNLVIPPIPFGRDMSPAKAVAVIDPGTARSENKKQAADIFIETELKPRSPYVQQQMLMKVTLYRAINVSSATLTDPTAGGSGNSGDLIVEKLGEDRSYPANYNGRRYMVVERNYALLPQASGKITIEPLRFEGQVGSSNRFGFDAFGGGRRLRVESDPTIITVRPIPPTFPGDHWLPAKKLSLTAEWSESQPEFRAGEPVTRVLRITAEGLAASQLPEIDLPLPAGVRSYRDQPQLQAHAEGNVVVSQREEKIALIPEQPGILKLPAINIPWWNTTTNSLEIASLPAVEIAVLPALSGSNDQAAPIALIEPLLPAPDLHSPAIVDPNSAATEGPPLQNSLARTTPWVIAALFALGWAITGYLWRRDRNQRSDKSGLQTNRELIRELHLACQANDKQLAAKALLAWGKLRHAGRPPPGLEALAIREDNDLTEQITLLAKSLYAETGHEWIGAPLWVAVSAADKPVNLRRAPSQASLAPLNPR